MVERLSVMAAAAADSAVSRITPKPTEARAERRTRNLMRALPAELGEAVAPPINTAIPAFLKREFWQRHWRTALGVGLLVGASYAASQPFLAVTTENTVVSANLLRLRAPIGGELLAGPQALRIHNPLADNHRLIDARLEFSRLSAEIQTVQARLGDLAALGAQMRQRADFHSQAAAAHLALQAREATLTRAAADARAVRATRDAVRSTELARAGVAAASQMDRSEAERAVARAEGDAAAARIVLLNHQSEAAARGIFTENGHIGTGYAEQRLDEITMRRMDLQRQEDQLRGALSVAESRVQQEEARHALLSTAAVTVPEGLQIWRTRALPGSRVAADETIAEVVDCRAPFLLAAIPQSQLSGLAVGSAVRLRLAGQRGEWQGRLSAFLPDSTAPDSMAALPTRPREPSILAQVALDAAPAGTPCPVGLTGRAVFERSAGWW